MGAKTGWWAKGQVSAVLRQRFWSQNVQVVGLVVGAGILRGCVVGDWW